MMTDSTKAYYTYVKHQNKGGNNPSVVVAWDWVSDSLLSYSDDKQKAELQNQDFSGKQVVLTYKKLQSIWQDLSESSKQYIRNELMTQIPEYFRGINTKQAHKLPKVRKIVSKHLRVAKPPPWDPFMTNAPLRVLSFDELGVLGKEVSNTSVGEEPIFIHAGGDPQIDPNTPPPTLDSDLWARYTDSFKLTFSKFFEDDLNCLRYDISFDDRTSLVSGFFEMPGEIPVPWSFVGNYMWDGRSPVIEFFIVHAYTAVESLDNRGRNNRSVVITINNNGKQRAIDFIRAKTNQYIENGGPWWGSR